MLRKLRTYLGRVIRDIGRKIEAMAAEAVFTSCYCCSRVASSSTSRGEVYSDACPYFEVLGAMLGSLGVIAAALVMMWKGWRLTDPIIGAGIGLFIVPRT